MGRITDFLENISLLRIKYDIIVITELWLTDEILEPELNNNYFNFYRKDRPSESGKKRGGGGVLIGINKKIW